MFTNKNERVAVATACCYYRFMKWLGWTMVLPHVVNGSIWSILLLLVHQSAPPSISLVNGLPSTVPCCASRIHFNHFIRGVFNSIPTTTRSVAQPTATRSSPPLAWYHRSSCTTATTILEQTHSDIATTELLEVISECRSLVDEEQDDVVLSILSSSMNTSSCVGSNTTQLQEASTNVVHHDTNNNCNDDPSNVEAPSLKKILTFAIPAIGVWLCNPLLSMIDTSTVGMLSGTIQQGALNPAVTVTDYSARIMAFLFVGTTNSVARAQEMDRRTKSGMVQTTKTVLGALQLSLWVGVILAGFLLTSTNWMLQSLMGGGNNNNPIDPAVVSAAKQYVRIRALGMPAAAVIGSAQAACLGLQDIQSPLYVIVTAALVNFFSDVILVGNSHPMIGGAAGAAWATIFSQYVAVTLFLKWLFFKPVTIPTLMNNGVDQEHQNLSIDLSSTIKPFTKRKRSRDESITKGLLSSGSIPRDFFRVPNQDTIRGFTQYFIPVTTTMIGRTSAYIAMNHVVSSCFGTLCMAANQIMTSVFYALVPISDSLSLTAQSFVPGICETCDDSKRAQALKITSINFFKAAILFGIVLSGIVSFLPSVCGRMFSSDPAVVALVNSLVPIQIIYFALHGIFCASEGILFGLKDLKYLGRMYAVSFAIVPWLMLSVKNAAQLGTTNLTSVWRILLGYQLARIVMWVGRVIWLQRKGSSVRQPSVND